jgi:hypothetical protein
MPASTVDVYWLLTADVATTLQTLTGTEGNPLYGIPVSVRKRLKVLDTDKLPLIIVAQNLKGEKKNYDTFPGPGINQTAGVVWDYPILVGFYTESLGQVQIGAQQQSLIHKTIRDQLYQLQPVLPPVVSMKQPYDVEIEPEAVFEADVGNRTEVDATGFQITYTVSEQRVS